MILSSIELTSVMIRLCTIWRSHGFSYKTTCFDHAGEACRPLARNPSRELPGSGRPSCCKQRNPTVKAFLAEAMALTMPCI
jgi:hypothetical protein